jgi:GT2 family glycosyltransferase
MNTLIGIVTFGNLPFTQMTIEAIEETTTEPYFIYAVVGKPGDEATASWLRSKDISHVTHSENMGFPSSLNDIYDFAWKQNNFDNLVIMGNDVIVLPYAVDSLIRVANDTDYIWISANEIDVRVFCAGQPEAKKYFAGGNFIFTDFDARPWKEFPPQVSPKIQLHPTLALKDCHNLTIFKREIFDKVGYIDVNYFPAYGEDTDFVRRAVVEGSIREKSKYLENAQFFHFWSRTVKQETGGSNNNFFRNNMRFFNTKWGGPFGKEKYTVPFNGQPHMLTHELVLQPDINIQSRKDELAIVNYWKQREGG